MKKLSISIFCIIISLSFCLTIFGCTPKIVYVDPGTDYEVNFEVDPAISETLSIGLYGRTKLDEKHYEELEKSFKLRFPNVNIALKFYTDDSYYMNLTQAYQSGTMPDIIMVNSAMSFVAIENKLLLNLKPFIDAENERYADNKEEYPDYFPYENYEDQFMDKMWMLGQKNYDGDQFFIPRSADRIVMMYNKTQFNAAGVNMSTVKNGWTWEDFLKACEKLKVYYAQNKGGKPFISGQWGWEAIIQPILASTGANVFDENGNVAIDSDQTREALKIVRDLVDLNYTTESAPNATDFMSKNAAIQFHSLYVDYFLGDMGSDLDLVTFPLIGKGDEGNKDYKDAKIGAGVAGYGIFSGISEKKRNLAWRFLSFMLEKEGQECMAKAGVTAPPMRKDMQDGSNLWRKNKGSINMEAYVWEPERNYFTDFYLGKEPDKQVELVETIKFLFLDHIMTNDPKTANASIEKCKNELNRILNSV